jgi:hypothetical protein
LCARLVALVATAVLIGIGAGIGAAGSAAGSTAAAGSAAVGEGVTVCAVGMLLSTVASIVVRVMSAMHDSHDAHATRVAITATAVPALFNVFWMLLRGVSIGGAGGVLDMGLAGVQAARALEVWVQRCAYRALTKWCYDADNAVILRSVAAEAAAARLTGTGKPRPARATAERAATPWVVPASVLVGEDEPLSREQALRFALQCAAAGNVYWLPLQDALMCTLAADDRLMAAFVGTKPEDFEENDVTSRKDEVDPTVSRTHGT